MAPRRKITKVGGNLLLVAQFRVLCRLGLLTMRHSFLFLSSSFFFFLFLLFSSLSVLLSSISLFLSSLSLFPSSSFSLLLYRLNWNPIYIGFKSDIHVDTWHAMCHTLTHGFPCVTHMVRHVSSTWLAMCRLTSVASKYVKF